LFLADVAARIPEQIHELKRDKFRSSPRRMEIRMRLWSRNGRDWSVEFVAITSAIMALPVTRIVLDGEAVACRTSTRCSGCATGLLHLDVKDLRPLELRDRRALLRKHRRKAAPALLYSEHLDGTDGEAMFRLGRPLRRRSVPASARRRSSTCPISTVPRPSAVNSTISGPPALERQAASGMLLGKLSENAIVWVADAIVAPIPFQ